MDQPREDGRRLYKVRGPDGEDAPDEALQAIGDALRSTLRTTDPVARIDKRRVAAVLAGCSRDDLNGLAQRLYNALDQSCEAELFMGAALMVPQHADSSPEALILLANKAVERARKGADRVCVL